MARRRPNPVLWLYFQYGGRLSPAYREWVLHDGTCRTWLLRALIRRLVQIAPIMAGLLLLLRGVFGGPWGLVLGSLLLGFLVFLRFGLAYASESVDARLTPYRYPARYGSDPRARRGRSWGAPG